MAPSVASFSWFEWHFHPDIILVVLLLEGAYLLGVGPWRTRFGWATAVQMRHVVLFSLGVVVLYVALTSPIHHLSDNFLFSAHMVQHLLLTLVTPPLLVAGTPGWLLRPLVRWHPVLATGRFLTHPVIAFLLFSFVFSIWHLPVLYDLTLRNQPAHIAEHMLFLTTAVIMWWPVLSPLKELPRASYPIQMLYLFFLSVPTGFIGGVITFSQEVLYPWYESVPRLWGISALADQQIGGLLMKIPGALTFLGVLTVVFFAWFYREERDQVDMAELQNAEDQALTPSTTSKSEAGQDS